MDMVALPERVVGIQVTDDEGVAGTPLTIAEVGVEWLPDTLIPKSVLISESILMMGWS
jgi:hypothetical protein